MVCLEVDSSPSTSFDLLPYSEFFQRVRKMSIIAAAPAMWARSTVGLKLYPSGRIQTRQDLALSTDLLADGELETRVEQYLAEDPIYQHVRKASAVTQRKYSLVLCFKALYHRGRTVFRQVSVLVFITRSDANTVAALGSRCGERGGVATS